MPLAELREGVPRNQLCRRSQDTGNWIQDTGHQMIQELGLVGNGYQEPPIIYHMLNSQLHLGAFL